MNVAKSKFIVMVKLHACILGGGSSSWSSLANYFHNIYHYLTTRRGFLLLNIITKSYFTWSGEIENHSITFEIACAGRKRLPSVPRTALECTSTYDAAWHLDYTLLLLNFLFHRDKHWPSGYICCYNNKLCADYVHHLNAKVGSIIRYFLQK